MSHSSVNLGISLPYYRVFEKSPPQIKHVVSVKCEVVRLYLLLTDIFHCGINTEKMSKKLRFSNTHAYLLSASKNGWLWLLNAKAQTTAEQPSV